MGRGNVCTHYECEGLYYLDKDLLSVYRQVIRCGCGHITGLCFEKEPMTARELFNAGIEYDFDGTNSGWAFDEIDSRHNWDEMIAQVSESLLERFKSFREVDAWRGERHIVLQSALFEIAVVDGEWCAAWCLLEGTDIDDTGSNRTFMRRHYQAYLEAIKLILVKGWGEVKGYGGAWTSGRRYTLEDIAS